MANPRHPNSNVVATNTAAPLPKATVDDVESGINNDFQLGTVTYGADNTQWALGVANGAVTTGQCTYNASTYTITSDTVGNHTADDALTDGQHGWVRLTAGATT